METELVCFPEPLNACFWLTYGTAAEPRGKVDDAAVDSALPTLKELFAEDLD